MDDFNQNAVVDYALYAGISPLDVEIARELDACGAAAFKVFLSDAGDYQYFTDHDLNELFKVTSKFNGLVSIHAETESMCASLSDKFRKTGCGAEKNGDSRPVISEILAASRLALLALENNARAHVCHISSSDVVDELDVYRRRGARITAETCPHYLSLTEADVVRCGTFAKCAPPLRDQATVDALWKKVIDGGIDIIGSDHATYSEESKSTASFWDAPGGFPGLDLFLATLITQGVHKRGLSWKRLAEITSYNAAKAFGLSHCKGSIEIGKDADLSVVDPNEEWVFHVSKSFYNNKSEKFPYENRSFKGRVTDTYIRGSLVYSGGVINEPFVGAFIPSKH